MIETPSTLIVRIRDPSDNAAWREFVSLYRPVVIGMVLQRGVDRREAEDVVQEVFLRLVKTSPDFRLDRKRGRFGTWLWKVTHNVVADYFRARMRSQREKQMLQEQVEKVLAAEDSVDGKWLEEVHRLVVRHALEQVRLETAAATWSCFEEHLLKAQPAQVVAVRLGVSAAAVYTNASRVLARVRQKCGECMEDLNDGGADRLSG